MNDSYPFAMFLIDEYLLGDRLSMFPTGLIQISPIARYYADHDRETRSAEPMDHPEIAGGLKKLERLD
jgi:hypothetical protein